MDSHRSASNNDPPSVDELLSIHDRQHLKPIGAERKNGLLSSGTLRSFESKETDHFDLFNRLSNYHHSSNSISSSSYQETNYSTTMMLTSTIPISYKTTSLYHPRIPHMSFRPTHRSTLPVFSAPFHCPRERFQVNSIGRPILRPHHYQYHSHGFSYPVRR